MQSPSRYARPFLLCRLFVIAAGAACCSPAQAYDRSAGSQVIEGSAFGEFGSPATSPQPIAPVMSDEKKGDLVIAPIPTRSPSQGWGLILVSQYIFKEKDQQSTTPPSIIGAGGFYTEEKSYGAFAGYLGHWQDDLWRPIFAGGYAHVNYDFYGIGTDAGDQNRSIPVEQDIGFVLAQMMRRLRPNLYGGVRVALADIDTRFKSGDIGVQIPEPEDKLSTYSAGPLIQWDTRDSQFYPTTGNFVNFSAMFFGGDREYQTYRFEWNNYRPLGERGILALRGFARTTGGDAPFYALSQFGMGSDLRGYTNGKYRDKAMFAVQTEYRHQLTMRWGFVAFAGVGEVMPGFDEIKWDNLLGSVGAGIRFRLSKENPINMRLDWAYGKDGPATYLQVNEAF